MKYLITVEEFTKAKEQVVTEFISFYNPIVVVEREDKRLLIRLLDNFVNSAVMHDNLSKNKNSKEYKDWAKEREVAMSIIGTLR